jgi:predicted phosphodiesterase
MRGFASGPRAATLACAALCAFLPLLPIVACSEAREPRPSGGLPLESGTSEVRFGSLDAGAPDEVGNDVLDRPLDVTFAVVSDTHLGHAGGEAKNRALVAALGALPGRPYPGGKRAGNVSHVRGLLIAGDLTDWGNPSEWDAFKDIFGLSDGGVGAPFPVFEVVGNHDKVRGPWLSAEVDKRHGSKSAYAWNWDSLHLVALGEAPEDEALDALERDLAKVDARRPLVLLFHRPLAGEWSEDRPSPRQKARLRDLLRGRDVVAIFHGHHHARAHYVWEGIDVFKPGAVKDGAPSLAVVHLAADSLTVATFDWQRGQFSDVWSKPRRKKAL